MGTVSSCYNCKFGGGDKQDRTADLLHAMQALSQLSYTPTWQDRDYNVIRRGRANAKAHPPERPAR
jgi:hypothetical protein